MCVLMLPKYLVSVAQAGHLYIIRRLPSPCRVCLSLLSIVVEHVGGMFSLVVLIVVGVVLLLGGCVCCCRCGGNRCCRGGGCDACGNRGCVGRGLLCVVMSGGNRGCGDCSLFGSIPVGDASLGLSPLSGSFVSLCPVASSMWRHPSLSLRSILVTRVWFRSSSSWSFMDSSPRLPIG